MKQTTFQHPELRDANDNIIQQGAFGKNTALANATNNGWIDYVANNLEFLYDIAKDEVVPVPSLPASGQTNKTYLLTTTGVSYRWSGTEWVAVSSSEAVGRAESAALLAEQWATKTDGTVDGTEYSAKYYAEQAEASADDAQDTADDMATHLVQIDKNTGGVAKNSKRISNIEKLLQGNLYDYQTDSTSAYTKSVPSGAMPYAGLEQIGGKTIVWNQLVNTGTTTVSTISGRKYYTLIDGTASIVTADGTAIAIVDDTADMVCDLTLMFGSGNEPSTTADFTAIFGATHYEYNAGELLSAGVTEVESVGKNNLCMNAYSHLTQGVQGTVQDGTSEVVLKGTNTSSSLSAWFNISMKKPLNAGTYTISGINGSFLSTAYLQFSYNGKSTYAYFHAVDSTFTVPDGATGFVIVCGVAPSATIDKIIQIQVEKGSTATVYSPYQEHSYPIPTAIRNLEGYGWSAGDKKNYIDFERKVYVQEVSKLSFAIADMDNSENFPGWHNSGLREIVGSGLNTVLTNSVWLFKNGSACSVNTMGSGDLLFLMNSGMTQTQWKETYPDLVVDFYIARATPIETDISAYLTDDNLISVESGGTLTFENQHGDDYRIPVPSEEEYMIDLQEAINNG